MKYDTVDGSKRFVKLITLNTTAPTNIWSTNNFYDFHTDFMVYVIGFTLEILIEIGLCITRKLCSANWSKPQEWINKWKEMSKYLFDGNYTKVYTFITSQQLLHVSKTHTIEKGKKNKTQLFRCLFVHGLCLNINSAAYFYCISVNNMFCHRYFHEVQFNKQTN